MSFKTTMRTSLTVSSNYDSCTHRGFQAYTNDIDSWTNSKSLDKVLTKDQIAGVEAILLSAISGCIKDNEKLKG